MPSSKGSTHHKKRPTDEIKENKCRINDLNKHVWFYELDPINNKNFSKCKNPAWNEIDPPYYGSKLCQIKRVPPFYNSKTSLNALHTL